MRKLAAYYSFIIVGILTVLGFAYVESLPQLVSASLFYPLFAYFALQILPKRQRAIALPVVKEVKPKQSKAVKAKLTKEEETNRNFDMDRRAFVKLVGTAGLTLLFLAMATKKAQGAFFGSVPGPGTVSLKDSSGNQIDPSEKQPTDGYRIVQIDETSDVPSSYFGFQNKDSAWFIMQDDGSGNFRYAKGSSDFTNATTGWPNRAALSYDYFDNIF